MVGTCRRDRDGIRPGWPGSAAAAAAPSAHPSGVQMSSHIRVHWNHHLFLPCSVCSCTFDLLHCTVHSCTTHARHHPLYCTEGMAVQDVVHKKRTKVPHVSLSKVISSKAFRQRTNHTTCCFQTYCQYRFYYERLTVHVTLGPIQKYNGR